MTTVEIFFLLIQNSEKISFLCLFVCLCRCLSPSLPHSLCLSPTLYCGLFFALCHCLFPCRLLSLSLTLFLPPSLIFFLFFPLRLSIAHSLSIPAPPTCPLSLAYIRPQKQFSLIKCDPGSGFRRRGTYLVSYMNRSKMQTQYTTNIG
jgi:hypothetical protein